MREPQRSVIVSSWDGYLGVVYADGKRYGEICPKHWDSFGGPFVNSAESLMRAYEKACFAALKSNSESQKLDKVRGSF